MSTQSYLGIILLLIFIIPLIFFLIELQNTLRVISPENRQMLPGNVWLVLIPFIGLLWQFIMVRRISDSIREECVRLNTDINERMPTYTIGLIYCTSSLLYMIPVPIIKVVGSLVALVSWVVYWIKVNRYKKLMIAHKDNYMLDAEREIFHTQL